MSRRGRIALFAIAGPGLAAVLILGFAGLPDFGHYHGVYGRVVIGVELAERHATDLVTALNFDIRAFDTLGEEFILFVSVLGISLILRQMRGEREQPHQQEADEHHFAGASHALRALALGLTPGLIALAVYIIVHAQLTPGGGFQGGIILGAGPLPVFLAGRYLRMKKIAPQVLLEVGDAVGAAGYALLGISGLVITGVFLKNALPLGVAGHILSAGQMDVASVLVGLEVSGAFLVAWSEFLDQAMVIQEGDQ
jgi:multicomponent Na+:H+ antiporter subunit B